MENVNITIIGAGVVGLAIAAELAQTRPDVLVIERHLSFGQETSSRNSEVIHAGIYYPAGTLKAKLCVEGRHRLYEYCEKFRVDHKRIGKYIVATNAVETGELESILKRGQANGVADLRPVSQNEIQEVEPQVAAQAAIFSPSTGIIDSHQLMKSLAYHCEDGGGMIIYGTTVTKIDPVHGGYELTLDDGTSSLNKVFSRIVINAAGLSSDKIAAMVGIQKPEYQLKFCKGDYFRVSAAKAKLVSHLIYPVPTQNHVGLGTHATLDFAGQMRLGPDTEYVEEIHYTVDPAKQKDFYESVKSFLPFIEFDDLTPDSAGMRPKLQGPGEAVKDFLIQEETDNGFSGFVNLIGIESPGLTACLAIAKKVAGLIG
ncbi:MAG: NAD(P)/FAD-dependent oxidoreductase [Candidatus Omnitrophica bacterium]|nr:NAD(P)/FAD-dependent oxidoreductase [Candidatus Omnitrophota bacterium]